MAGIMANHHPSPRMQMMHHGPPGPARAPPPQSFSSSRQTLLQLNEAVWIQLGKYALALARWFAKKAVLPMASLGTLLTFFKAVLPSRWAIWMMRWRRTSARFERTPIQSLP